mgnify:CR=1 FL=1
MHMTQWRGLEVDHAFKSRGENWARMFQGPRRLISSVGWLEGCCLRGWISELLLSTMAIRCLKVADICLFVYGPSGRCSPKLGP